MKKLFIMLIIIGANIHALELEGLVSEGSVLLKSLYFESDLVGVSLNEVESQCELLKEKHKKAYVHVYCIYHVKSKITYATSTTTSQWNTNVSTDESSYEYEYEYATDLSNFEYEYEYKNEDRTQTNTATSGSSHTTIVIPVKHSFYGVNIYGIGNPNSQERFLVFDMRSEKYFSGFQEYRAANRSCQEYIFEQDDHDSTYYKAFCEVVRSDIDGLYRYAVYSKFKLN